MLKMFSHRWARIDTDFDYVFDFVLLWEPKGSVVATDANVPRRRCALAAVGYAECRRPDGKRERSDALSVRIRVNPWEITKKRRISI